MRHHTLTGPDRWPLGFTDLYIVTAADLSSEENGAVENVVLGALAVGDLLMCNTLLEVKRSADGLEMADGSIGPSSGGVVVDVADLTSAGDGYYAGTAAYMPLPIKAAANLLFVVAPGEEEAAGSMTAGEFWIWATISRKANRRLQV